MAKMSVEVRERFLAKTRYGYLTTLTRDGAPSSVPVWFDWNGRELKIFTSKSSPKVKRINHDSRITFLVANHIDEPEAWVAFDGKATIHEDDNMGDFVEKLATKYWDLSNPKLKDILDTWLAESNQFCMIELVPTQIRSYS